MPLWRTPYFFVTNSTKQLMLWFASSKTLASDLLYNFQLYSKPSINKRNCTVVFTANFEIGMVLHCNSFFKNSTCCNGEIFNLEQSYDLFKPIRSLKLSAFSQKGAGMKSCSAVLPKKLREMANTL